MRLVSLSRVTFALTNRDHIPSFYFIPLDLSFRSLSPLLTMYLAQYTYPILLFSKIPPCAPTRSVSCSLLALAVSPLSFPFSSISDFSYHPTSSLPFPYCHQDLLSNVISLVSPHFTACLWMYARLLSHILVTSLYYVSFIMSPSPDSRFRYLWRCVCLTRD